MIAMHLVKDVVMSGFVHFATRGPLHYVSMIAALAPALVLAAPIDDRPFEQLFREAFYVSENSAENDVWAIALDGEQRVWLATSKGVRALSGSAFVEPAGTGPDGPAFDLFADPKGDIWVAAWNGLYRIHANEIEKIDSADEPLSAVSGDAERLVFAGPDGYWQRRQGKRQPIEGRLAGSPRAVLSSGEELWAATQRGLFLYSADEPLRWFNEENALHSCNTRALARDQHGRIWVGTNRGIDVYWDGRRVRSLTAEDGLPSTDVAALAVTPDGRLWGGTSLGVAVYDGRDWSLYHSRRWLPDDRVRDIAFARDGTAWIATAGGVAELRSRKMTLAEKALYFEEVMRLRHVREPGLMRRAKLSTPGDVSTFGPTDTDNDGLFTGMYLGAESYRYAVTGDEAARQTAEQAFRGLEFLQTVTETPGFVARTVVPADWTSMADANRQYTPKQTASIRVFDPRWKSVETRWRKSADGQWLWKGDTSSDEITGHYFAYAVYYDHVARGEEQARVANLVRRITDHIIDGGFVFRDVDGEATRWGVWSPEKLNDDPNWQPERGINSVEILSYLNVAYHMTGDEKYRKASDYLYDEHGYRENVLNPQTHDAGTFTFIDAQLLALAYPSLIGYETDPERKKVYHRSLSRWFEVMRFARGPLYNFVYYVLSGDEQFDRQACAAYLRDTPLDLITWRIDHSEREDIEKVKWPQAERWQTDRLLPPSERAVIHWDGNPFAIADGDGGHGEKSASFWLLPYWMGRQYGIISPPQDD